MSFWAQLVAGEMRMSAAAQVCDTLKGDQTHNYSTRYPAAIVGGLTENTVVRRAKGYVHTDVHMIRTHTSVTKTKRGSVCLLCHRNT